MIGYPVLNDRVMVLLPWIKWPVGILRPAKHLFPEKSITGSRPRRDMIAMNTMPAEWGLVFILSMESRMLNILEQPSMMVWVDISKVSR